MSDREKDSKGIQECDLNGGLIGNCPYKGILALLKEQEAVEARKKNDGKPQPWTSWWYVCGDCGQEIEYHDRFCRWCGRSVKWK
jgi:hypothetical protein